MIASELERTTILKTDRQTDRQTDRPCFWDGGQTVQTLTARNAGGAQRMPDKQHFQCVIDKDKETRMENIPSDMKYIVRRLTPTECARLQGFPDWWADIDIYEELDDDQYQFWLDVRKTYDEINGRKPKNYTREQILKWHNGLHTDASEYKMWGNGIALPCFEFVMQGIQETREDGD